MFSHFTPYLVHKVRPAALRSLKLLYSLCPAGQCLQGFLFSSRGCFSVHSGRCISCPLFASDFCCCCRSNTRHGGHWYIPWESTGYPKVIMAISRFFCFFCSLDDFPRYLFSNGGQCMQSFLYFCFPPSAKILLITYEVFFSFFLLKGKLCNPVQLNGENP